MLVKNNLEVFYPAATVQVRYAAVFSTMYGVIFYKSVCFENVSDSFKVIVVVVVLFLFFTSYIS